MPRDSASAKQQEEFVEVDPSNRYGRYSEVLGRGAYKKVYKAFDELEGMEVAWNQVKVQDVLRKSDDLERLYSEVHLLQTLKHKNIIKCYSSWVDTEKDNINFITEVFTSGNLREYRNKHKHVNIRALKNWSRQILQGLDYLHSHDPPVIHRDLKCDNIFINGNQGEVKIGDLGLAAILYQAHAAHSVIGTPEFMAPELYEEEYNELVDIYAFGMCLLELVTFEYPYSECSNAAQIFKKVSTGIKPASLAKVKDPEVKKFIEKCIAVVSERLSARELLQDPFLVTTSDTEKNGRHLSSRSVVEAVDFNQANSQAGPSEVIHPAGGREFTVEARRKDVQTIFLKLKVQNSSGKGHDIHFPFDVTADTSTNVATEMVTVLNLGLTEQDISAITALIDSEIQKFIPGWMSVTTADKSSNDETETINSECNDEVSDLPAESELTPSGYLLERLPSGRMFWRDPSESNEDSSGNRDTGAVKSDLATEVSGEQEADGAINDEETCTVLPESEMGIVEVVLCKLEELLIKQQKEVDEMQKKHEEAVEELLGLLPEEFRRETLRKCKLKVPVHTVMRSNDSESKNW